MKKIYKPLSALMSGIMLAASLSFNTAFAAGDASSPYTLSMGSNMFTFDGWGLFPASVPQSDFVKNKIYSDLGINIIRVELYSDCDASDKLITSTAEFQHFLKLVSQAQEYGLDYMITVWTPPVSMKTNGRKDNSPDGYLKTDKEQAFCDYVVQVFDYLKQHSLPLPLAFGFANEPNHEHTYQACDYYDGQLERVLKLFDTTFENAGYGDVLICTPEESAYSENYKIFSDSTTSRNNALLEDAEYKAAYDVLAFHGYAWDVSSNLAPIVKRSDSYMAGKEIWATESCTNAYLPGKYIGPSEMLRKINFHTQIYEANRWIYWRGFDSIGGYDAALMMSDGDSSIKTMATYYFMKALFNNVPAGSKVAGVTTNDPAYDITPTVAVRNTDLLDIGGFRTDNGQVFTLYNSTSAAKYYNVSGLTGDTVLIYRFDNAGNIAHETVSGVSSTYNKLCVSPGESVIFVSGNGLNFGDDPVIGADNADKVIIEKFVSETAPVTDSEGASTIGTVRKADGTVGKWKTTRPDLLAIRRDEIGFGDEYFVVKGQSDNVFAYTNGSPALYSNKDWALRFTADLNQCSWKNVYGPEDTYTTMFATTYQPFSNPASTNNQNAFAVIITKNGMLRLAGGESGSYFVYMADESRLNPSNFDPMGVHTYTIEKNGSDIEITVDGISLGKLTKMAHISNADVGYYSDMAIAVPSAWGSNVTAVDKNGNSVTHTADFDLTAYSPRLKYIAAANQVIVDGTNYRPLWQTKVYPGLKDVEIIEDISLHQLAEFSDASAAFGNDYSLLFNIENTFLPSEGVTSYKVKLTNGQALETYSSDAPLSDGNSSFAFTNTNPTGIDDTITAMLTVNYSDTDFSSCIKKYSLKQYCYDKLDYFASKSTLTAEERKLKKVIIDLLNYCASVQEYTNGKLAAHQLANYGLSTADKTVASSVCSNIKAVANDVASPVITWNAVKAVFDNSVRLRFYVDIPSGTDVNTIKAVVMPQGNPSYEISGMDFVKENGTYYFETENIGFLSFSNPMRVQVRAGNNPLSKTLTYSVESYAAYHKTQSADSGFDKVVNTMINLGKSLSAYASQ